MAVPSLTLMLATTNLGKAAEFRSILAGVLDLTQVRLLTPPDWPSPLPEIAETGSTFAENARLKASGLADATGQPALSDDSGLCVDALDGAPGLYSARWAGPGASDADRNDRLLQALEGVPPARRTARFVCAASLAVPGRDAVTAEGVCAGIILPEKRGSGGFGYDPLFFLPDLGRTMAELSEFEKNTLSHRALAVAALAPFFCTMLRFETPANGSAAV